MSNATPAALANLRVLDLTDLKGALCAKLLGDMGADVIKLEPPDGDAMRSIGPFLDGKPHRDRSLLFWFYNTSKRGITLDLSQTTGQDVFKQLVAKVDVIVESFAPGTLTQLGLGYEALKR
jgi:crotonobetainyl-CoA:carnitine CoA-transferase CaiB-like acyl-CoA transferase